MRVVETLEVRARLVEHATRATTTTTTTTTRSLKEGGNGGLLPRV